MAQLVGQLICNQWVKSSSLFIGSRVEYTQPPFFLIGIIDTMCIQSLCTKHKPPFAFMVAEGIMVRYRNGYNGTVLKTVVV